MVGFGKESLSADLGGSIEDEGVEVGTTGSGRSAMAPSADEVSSVMCTVFLGPCRSA